MNKSGYSGLGKGRSDIGRRIKGIDIQSPGWVPAAVPGACSDPVMCRRFPLVELTENATPFVIIDMVWTGSVWAAISTTQFATSTDLVNWTTPVSLPGTGTYNGWTSIGWNGSMYVVVSSAVWSYPNSSNGWVYTGYSSDGITWNSGTSSNLGESSTSSRVVWTGAAWIFTTTHNQALGYFRSTDGIAFSYTATDYSLGSVVLTDGAGTVLLRTFNQTLHWKSTNHGASWTLTSIGGTGALGYDDVSGVWTAFGRTGRSYSSDLVNWVNSSVIAFDEDTNTFTVEFAANEQYVMDIALSVQYFFPNALIIASKHPDDKRSNRLIVPSSTGSRPLKGLYRRVVSDGQTIVAIPALPPQTSQPDVLVPRLLGIVNIDQTQYFPHGSYGNDYLKLS